LIRRKRGSRASLPDAFSGAKMLELSFLANKNHTPDFTERSRSTEQKYKPLNCKHKINKTPTTPAPSTNIFCLFNFFVQA